MPKRDVPISEPELPLDPEFDISLPPLKEYPYMAIDIETTNLRADFGMILCVGFKPLDKPPIIKRLDEYSNRDPWDDTPLLLDIVDILSACGKTYGWYSQPFDIRYIRTKLLMAGITERVAFRHCDLYRVFRQNFLFHNNRLETAINNLSKYRKTPIHPEYWRRAAFGNKHAMDKVVEHCVNDICGTEDVFVRIDPWIQTWSQVVL